MKNKKLLSILTTIAVVACCLPGFVLADNDVVVDETTNEVEEDPEVEETTPLTVSYEVVETEASVSPAYATDTDELDITYISREWDSVNSLVTEKEKTLTLGEGERLYTVAELNEITYTTESGWCYVDSDSELTCRFSVTANKTLNIILADGVTLDCPSGIFVEEGAILNVYGQHNDSGVLNATVSEPSTLVSGRAAIGGDSRLNAGTINIYGGTIYAEGETEGAGIGGGKGNTCAEVRIYGGNVTAVSYGNCNIGSYAGFTFVYYYGGCITLPPTGSPHTNFPQSIVNMCVRNETGAYYSASNRGVLYQGPDAHTLTICPCQHSHFTEEGVCDYCGYQLGESAQFIGHAMRLTGDIGLQFYVKLPTNSAEGYYMTFEGQGMDSTNPVELIADSEKTGVENSFYALVSLSSIQMAESFIPTLHCPDGSTIPGSAYSAQDYIAWGKDNTSLSTDHRNIIQALGDYGYFAQRYLSNLRSWTLGTDYAAMTVRGSDEDYSKRYDTFREWIAEHATSGIFNSNNGYFASATFNLKFDSLVTMYVYLTPIDGVSIDTSLIIQGRSVEQLSDGRILITFPDLPIDALDNVIHINYGDTPVVEISPLTYVYTAIGSSSSMSSDGKNMVCALFRLFAEVVYPTTG